MNEINKNNDFHFDSTLIGLENDKLKSNLFKEVYLKLDESKSDDFRIKCIQLLGWSNRDFVNKLSGFAEVTESEIMVINLIAENL